MDLNHSNGVCQMNTGQIFGGRPSLGSWVTYGLGTVNENLPAFVVLEDAPGKVVNGPRNYGAGFMPALYQGTALRTGDEPIPNLHPAKSTSDRAASRKARSLLDSLNREHAASRTMQSELDARIRSYELAFRMQANAPEAVDLAQETDETKSLYGIDEKETDTFGRNCLLARRLVERGVRFVQLYHGSGSKWDAHSNIEGNHTQLCRESDKPIAGLLKDLKRRGLLERHARRLGRRIRSHADERKRKRPRSQSLRLHHVARRRRRARRPRRSARPTNSACTPSKIACTSTTSTPRCCTCSASITCCSPIYHKGRPERPTSTKARRTAKSPPSSRLPASQSLQLAVKTIDQIVYGQYAG